MVSCLGESVGSVDEGRDAVEDVDEGGPPEGDVGGHPGSEDEDGDAFPRYLGKRTPLWTQAKTVLR